MGCASGADSVDCVSKYSKRTRNTQMSVADIKVLGYQNFPEFGRKIVVGGLGRRMMVIRSSINTVFPQYLGGTF